MGEIRRPKEFFEDVLPARFDPEKAAGLSCTIQMNIDGEEGGKWYITIRDQKLEVAQGEHPNPDILIRMKDKDFVDVMNGKITAERAYMMGKLKFKGNLGLGTKLRSLGII